MRFRVGSVTITIEADICQECIVKASCQQNKSNGSLCRKAEEQLIEYLVDDDFNLSTSALFGLKERVEKETCELTRELLKDFEGVDI